MKDREVRPRSTHEILRPRSDHRVEPAMVPWQDSKGGDARRECRAHCCGRLRSQGHRRGHRPSSGNQGPSRLAGDHKSDTGVFPRCRQRLSGQSRGGNSKPCTGQCLIRLDQRRVPAYAAFVLTEETEFVVYSVHLKSNSGGIEKTTHHC